MIVEGKFVPYYTEDVCVIAYLRILGERELLVIHNFQSKNGRIRIPEGFVKRVVGNREETDVRDRMYDLRPYECVVFYKGD